ncbi:MAG: hypothetical protein A4E19_20135 [Nitrospira sp. SG-bin1]|nr:MAG: hypothetical protein A4E19_20135 [Nitrospira sp. SG-bin1]
MLLNYSASSFARSFSFLILPLLCLEQAYAKDFNPDNPLNQPAPVYWCSSKAPDQQISTQKGSGCEPLYDQQAAESFREKARQQGFDFPDRNPIKIAELQNAASKYSDRYRAFVSCCLTDHSAPGEIVDLIDEANHILKTVQQKGIFNSRTFARQLPLNEMVGTITRARGDLFRLYDRLDKLNKAQQGLDQVDYEASGRAKVQIQEEEEAIKKEFRAKKPPSSAPTGMEIQDTTLRSRIGGDIEDTKLNSHFGADINYLSPYSRIGESLRPRRGEDIHDSNIPHRPGTDIQDTSMPSGTGFEVDSTQNREGMSTLPRRGVGASIGDSDLNSRKR